MPNNSHTSIIASSLSRLTSSPNISLNFQRWCAIRATPSQWRSLLLRNRSPQKPASRSPNKMDYLRSVFSLLPISSPPNRRFRNYLRASWSRSRWSNSKSIINLSKNTLEFTQLLGNLDSSLPKTSTLTFVRTWTESSIRHIESETMRSSKSRNWNQSSAKLTLTATYKDYSSSMWGRCSY